MEAPNQETYQIAREAVPYLRRILACSRPCIVKGFWVPPKLRAFIVGYCALSPRRIDVKFITGQTSRNLFVSIKDLEE